MVDGRDEAPPGAVVVVGASAGGVEALSRLHAVDANHPEYVVGLAKMGAAVKQGVERARALPSGEPKDDQDAHEVELAEFEFETGIGTKLGEESPFSCPTCGGVLREAPDAVLRFRCRVGHGFGADSLLHAQSGSIDDALWMALRALQERAELAARLKTRMEHRGHEKLAHRYERRRNEAEQAATRIREVLLERDAESA
jgi:two-component system chemotaxis response regulator CheB